ncbi:MAG: hypothetical protein MUD12_05835 [Spirochaetes bacterium]|jgi:hypothetical protein|nr:hypothetical protein [Spirochaetota bacterium]
MDKIYRGFLRLKNGAVCLADAKGKKILEDCAIWSGYQEHWMDKALLAKILPQRDYESGKNIIIMWPDEAFSDSPYTDIYYNERLVKYPASLLGHLAININGSIFNFSHLINENEIISPAEYFYRPALGEFAPHPVLNKFNVEDSEKPYYDKFGRRFMRSIHVLRVYGLDIDRLHRFFISCLEMIKSTPTDPSRPHKYRDFSVFTKSCSTIIRDGLNEYGFKVKGIFPRDVFVSAALRLTRLEETGKVKMLIFKMNQLKVREAPYSKPSPLINPANRLRLSTLKKIKPEINSLLRENR